MMRRSQNSEAQVSSLLTSMKMAACCVKSFTQGWIYDIVHLEMKVGVSSYDVNALSIRVWLNDFKGGMHFAGFRSKICLSTRREPRGAFIESFFGGEIQTVKT